MKITNDILKKGPKLKNFVSTELIVGETMGAIASGALIGAGIVGAAKLLGGIPSNNKKTTDKLEKELDALKFQNQILVTQALTRR